MKAFIFRTFQNVITCIRFAVGKDFVDFRRRRRRIAERNGKTFSDKSHSNNNSPMKIDRVWRPLPLKTYLAKYKF